MKNYLCLIVAAFLVGNFLFPLVSYAGVEGQYLDQKNEGPSKVGDFEPLGAVTQTFIPTVTKITAIELYLENQTAGDTLSVALKKYEGPIIAPAIASTPFVGGNGWVTISYDAPYVAVTPTNRYEIVPTINGSNATKWSWTSGNLYTHGQALGTVGNDRDFLFRVYGTKITASPTSSTAVVSQPTSNAATAVTKETAVPSSTAPVDANIQAPVLVRYDINQKPFSPPTDGVVRLAKGDKLKLAGTSFSSAKVIVFVGAKRYIADIVESGIWEVEINIESLNEETQTIKAQALKGDKGSEIVDLLKVSLSTKEIATVEPNALLLAMSSPWVIGGLGLLLLVFIALLIFLELKYHGLAKLFKKNDEQKNTVDF